MAKKKSSGSRAKQPVVPQVSMETWKALLPAADEFKHLAPWRWMHDSQIIGLRYPATKEVFLSAILGRMRAVFALLLYRNAAGHRWLLNTILNEGDPGGFEGELTAFEQDLIKVEFVQKRELEKEDREILAACKYAPRAQGGPVWPQFRSLFPTFMPWFMAQEEAEKLLFALPRVTAVARLAHQQPELWDNHLEGEIAFVPDDFNPATDQLTVEQLTWEPMLPPPAPPITPVFFNEKTIAKIQALRRAAGFHLELDISYAPISFVHKGKPQFTKLAIAVDQATGYIGGLKLASFNDPDGADALGKVMLDAMKTFGHQPASLCVQRPRVEAMVTEVARMLDLPIHCEFSLDSLNAARDNLTEQLWQS
jgi:hypothetical protein